MTPTLPPLLNTLTPRRVTVKDVAAQAGVSHSAVCIVLNGAKSGNTGVSEAARERIFAAAADLGYRRNGSMGAAKSGQFNALGLLLSTNNNCSTLPPGLLQGINEAINASDLHLILHQLADAKLTDAAFVPKMLREWMCDGLLIDYTHNIPPSLLDLIRQNHTPAIWLNTKLASDCIHPDDFQAARLAVQYLVGLGHERIWYASQLDNEIERTQHYSVRDRREGFKEAIESAGLDFYSFAPASDISYEERVASWVEKLRNPKRPTAIIVYGGFDLESVHHASDNAGLRIPQDLSLITFGENPTTLRGKSVTRMAIPAQEMGAESVKLLIQKIQQPEVEIPPLVLRFGFDEGQTCASAPQF